MRQAVTTVLAGGVESPPLALKIWTRLMLWGVGIDRITRRLRGQAPAERPGISPV